MFAQTEGENSWKTRVNYHNCGKKGNIAQECPERKQAGNQEHIHANIQEDGCNEDDIDEGENMLDSERLHTPSSKLFAIEENISNPPCGRFSYDKFLGKAKARLDTIIIQSPFYNNIEFVTG